MLEFVWFYLHVLNCKDQGLNTSSVITGTLT